MTEATRTGPDGAVATVDGVGIRVIDTDTHVTEPPDLWTSRVPARFVDQVPQVGVHPVTGHHHWQVAGTWLAAVGYFAFAGWPNFPPDMPNELSEVDPGAFDPTIRLARMDEYGIYAHVLYPNLIGFESPLFMKLGPELSLLCTQAYNDYLVEFASADPDRFVPIAMVPFWDLDAAVTEMTRAAGLGHRGVLFANKYEKIGLPHFCDPYWDPIYAAAQDLGLSINFHVGFSSYADGTHTADKKLASQANFDPRAAARGTSVGIMTNAESIAAIVTTGVCDRFPRLDFVSVEAAWATSPTCSSRSTGTGRATGPGQAPAPERSTSPASATGRSGSDQDPPAGQPVPGQLHVRDGLPAPDVDGAGSGVAGRAAGHPHRPPLRHPRPRGGREGAPRQRGARLPPRLTTTS